MLDYRILGPLEVSVDERVIEIRGPKQRALLAILLLRANEPVSRDVLVHELWGEHPPAGAQGSLDVYVSRLRRVLTKAAGEHVLVTRPGAYRLQVTDEQFDVRRFERLVAGGRSALAAGQPGPAGESLRAALRLWRGDPLADLAGEPFAQVEIGRLEELRLGAVEDRIEADLALGRHAEVVGELEALAAAHPLRERVYGQLMLALYRCGRQAEALEVYRKARRTLVDELALEPVPALQRLEQAILRQDPSLELPAPAAAPAAPATPARPAVRGAWVAAAAVIVAAVVVAGLLLAPGAAPGAGATLAGTNGLLAVDLAAGRPVATARLDGAPEGLSGGANSVWAADPGGGAVIRVDPDSGAEVDRILVGGEPGGVVSGGDAIWAVSTVGATLTRIDPATEAVTQTIPLPGSALAAIAYGAGRLWVADSSAREVFEIDPASGSLRRTLPLDLQPSALAVAGGALWVAGYGNATVERLAPASGRVTGRVHVGNGPAALAFGAGSLWVANGLDATVSRVALRALTVRATIPVGDGPAALAAGRGSVWVANQYAGSVTRIDPRRDRVAATLAVGGSPTSLTLGRGRLWVGVGATGASHRGGTFVIVTPQTLTSSNPMTQDGVDPAIYTAAFNPQFTGLAYDSLVTFEESAGSAGLRLVPDLALAIPAPVDGGRTYTFRLRQHIRYSDGRTVRASDFRRGMERLFRVHSPGTSFFSLIVGAAACARHPAGCDLSRGIVTDDATGSVTFHLTAPDPPFLFNLTEDAFAAPIPPGTPDRETGSHTVPGTGPYRIVAVSSKQIRFARNPYFREWSHAAQPAGNPDAIVWRTTPTVPDGIAAVEHGRADLLYGLIPPAQYRRLELHSASQLHSSPVFGVEFTPLNTHRPPFDDVRVRRALNYAIDRAKMLRLYGGPAFAAVTCQVIAPGLPGYRRYCPYTTRPRADGGYTGPGLARARRLVRASGTHGDRIDLWGSTDNSYVPQGLTVYLAGVLRHLGYRVRLHLVTNATFTDALRARIQLSTDGDWVANYPDPSAYLPQFFGCGGGYSNGYYCDPRLDREMRQAGLLELSNPAKATALWAVIDRQITDAAPWVTYATENEVDLVSRRLRNYEFNPVWDLLVDQAWLR
jgi:ABC-type transport system substrate-binding protein/DNA-binding SARP family transcriptional activator